MDFFRGETVAGQVTFKISCHGFGKLGLQSGQLGVGAEVGLGSNRDRHTTLGKGTIGKGMATFLGHPAFQGLPAILETPDADGSYADELRLLRRLHKKGLAAA